MLEYTWEISNRSMIGILRRTFDHVDPRLINHGMRVGHQVSRMLRAAGDYDALEQRDFCLLAMLHDIGAYKTEEIDQMIRFETGGVWEHAVYGYLFFKFFSLFGEKAQVVLWHHAATSLLQRTPMDERCRQVAQMINLCDRVDMFYENGQGGERLDKFIATRVGTVYSEEIVALYNKAWTYPLSPRAYWEAELDEVLSAAPFTDEEIDACIKMAIYAIDFRSQHTVTHTVTTSVISQELARLLGFDRQLFSRVSCGALLHDLGKIGIPVEILEAPGGLSAAEMAVMRTHVTLTAEIIDGGVDETTRRIALRHHEKLDGSGYPEGLTAASLTTSERAVAVADIVSALSGTRSYKTAFPREETLGIMRGMVARGLIDADIFAVLEAHFDAIMEKVAAVASPLVETYGHIRTEYERLLGLLDVDVLNAPEYAEKNAFAD